MKTKQVLLVVLVVMAMLLALGGSLAMASPGDPLPSGVMGYSRTYTFYPATQITTTATKYSDSPRYQAAGLDMTLMPQWNHADVFVTADVSGTVALTVTPQLSVDDVNWTSADYTYVTFNSTGTATINTGSYALSFSADGTKYARVPLAGSYLRFQIESTATSSQTVTPTIKVVYKQN